MALSSCPRRRPTISKARVVAVTCTSPRLRESAIEMEDRKSTRLNSSHLGISYAVFCLKKKKKSKKASKTGCLRAVHRLPRHADHRSRRPHCQTRNAGGTREEYHAANHSAAAHSNTHQ